MKLQAARLRSPRVCRAQRNVRGWWRRHAANSAWAGKHGVRQRGACCCGALQCATCTSASVCCSSRLQNTHMWRETAARRSGCTCTLLTPPPATHSITQPARRHVALSLTSTLPGAEASRPHAVATQPNMARAGTRAGQPSRTQSRGGSGCCRRRLVPATGHRPPTNHAAALMSCSGRMTCTSAACSLGSSGMLMWGSDSLVPAK